MKNEARVRANVLKKRIDELKSELADIERQDGISLKTYNVWITRRMPASTNKIIRTIVEAELMDQLKKLEDEMESL